MAIDHNVAARQRNGDSWRQVITHFCETIDRCAIRWNVSPGEILAAGRRKTQDVTRAREELLDTMERTVLFVDEGALRDYRVDKSGGSLDGWEPISRPDLGYLAGLDQSSVTLSIRRCRARRRKAAADAKTAPSYSGVAL